MAVDVLTETVIERPREQVAAYAADPSSAPEWYENIEAAEWKTPPPLRTGSRVAFVARFLGRRLAYTYEVVEHVPGKRLVMRTAEGPFRSSHRGRDAPRESERSGPAQDPPRAHVKKVSTAMSWPSCQGAHDRFEAARAPRLCNHRRGGRGPVRGSVQLVHVRSGGIPPPRSQAFPDVIASA